MKLSMFFQNMRFSKKRRNKNAAGFTLIELLVVVAITLILGSVAIPIYRNFLDNARLVASVSSLDQYRNGLEGYFIDHANYPTGILYEVCKDENGNAILPEATCDDLNKRIFSWDSYDPAGEALANGQISYTLVATANNTDNTILTLTSAGVSYE